MNSIETVFEWLLAATLRASVLVVVILCIQWVLRRWLPASWRHALWLPMLAVLVLPVLPEAPFALFPKTRAVPAPVSVEIQIPDPLPVPTASDAIFTPTVAAPVAPAKVNFFALAWLAGAGIVLAAGGIGYHRNLRRIRTNATSPDRLLQITLAETALEAGLKREPRTVISPAIASPAVTGFVCPVLLLPAGFPAGFSPTEARLILLHEFTHLKRFDLPLNWLMCVLQAMHWFNPLLWFAFARMRADRELACDARVLSIDASDHRAEYGGALLKLQCVTPTRALSLGFVGIFARGSEIKSRIREISTHRRTRLARQIAGGVIVSLLMIFGITKGQQASPPADAPESVKEDPAKALIQNKLNTLIIPRIGFEDVSVEEAIDFLRIRAAQLDVGEKDPIKKGINFVIRNPRNAAAADAPAPMIRELRLRNVSLGTALKEICEQANLSYTVDETGVVISPKNEVGAEPALPAVPADADPAKTAVIQNKLKSIIIPRIDFEKVSLEEAIDFMRVRAAELDVTEKDPDKKGINFVIRNPAAVPAPMIRELRVRNVPLATVLKYICDQTKFRYTVEDTGVILSPQDEAGAKPAKPAIEENPPEKKVAPDTSASDAERASHFQAALEALKKGDGTAFAAIVPGLTPEEATKMIQQMGAAWGDLSKLTVRGDFHKRPALNPTKVIAKWGTWATKTNLQENLFELHSDAVPGRRLEMGFSYRKGESKPARFMAGEEWPSGAAEKSPAAQNGESQAMVTIGGHVRRPGPVPFVKGLTIYQAIQATGGSTEFASMRRVKIIRMGETRVHDLTKEDQKSVLLRKNDTIEVPQKAIFGD